MKIVSRGTWFNYRWEVGLLAFLFGIMLGMLLDLAIQKPCHRLIRHKVGMTKLQYGIALTCCGDTVCILEQSEFYRYYLDSRGNKKKVKCKPID